MAIWADEIISLDTICLSIVLTQIKSTNLFLIWQDVSNLHYVPWGKLSVGFQFKATIVNHVFYSIFIFKKVFY